LRLYTFYSDGSDESKIGNPIPAPATVEFSIGQNEFVTGGHLSGMVGHVAATYPFPLGARNQANTVVLYLFGEATTAYKHAEFNTPLTLVPAIVNGTPVALSDPSVFTATVPGNRRDTYRIGAALDLLTVWKALNKPAQTPPGGSAGSGAHP